MRSDEFKGVISPKHLFGPVSKTAGLNHAELRKIPQLPNKVLKRMIKGEGLEEIDRDILDIIIAQIREAKIRKTRDGR